MFADQTFNDTNTLLHTPTKPHASDNEEMFKESTQPSSETSKDRSQVVQDVKLADSCLLEDLVYIEDYFHIEDDKASSDSLTIKLPPIAQETPQNVSNPFMNKEANRILTRNTE